MAPKQCTIVGGSLAGLFAGVALKRCGYAVTILERNDLRALPHQGAGIVAGEEILNFFHQHDRTRHGLAVTSPLRQYLDKNGAQIHREAHTQQMTSWDLLYHLLRANFDGMKSDYCNVPEPSVGDGTAEYKYDHSVTGVRNTEDGVEVSYESKTTPGNQDTSTSGSFTTPLLLAADGPSSTLRRHLLPDIERTYAGYVAWRGTVVESALSEDTRSTFVEKFTFFHAPELQILSYTIPGENGSLETGQRLVNWVWYCNYPEGSEEYKALLTDVDGRQHHVSISGTAMQPDVIDKQRKHAQEVLPPQFAELVTSTDTPFVQAITDVAPQKASFFDGKMLLIGDAFAGFRPHTAMSTGQAAFHASLLEQHAKGEIDVAGMEEQMLDFGKSLQRHGVQLGQRSQFGKHPLA